jgi:S-adenosylmethionine decarboxylase
MNFIKSNQKFKYYEKEVSEDYFIIEKNITFAGTHIILDLWNCSSCNKITTLKRIIKEAASLSKANILHMHMHRFGKEQGISGVAVLAESHISVHTWPERNYMAFDIFMCGNTYPELASEFLVKILKPKRKKIEIIKRGIIKIDKKMC